MERDVMLAHVAVPMTSARTPAGQQTHHHGVMMPLQPPRPFTDPGATYTVDSISKDAIVSPRRHLQPQQQHLNVSVIEEELSTVSTPLMSSSSGQAITSSTATLSRAGGGGGGANPRESAV